MIKDRLKTAKGCQKSYEDMRRRELEFNKRSEMVWEEGETQSVLCYPLLNFEESGQCCL